MNIIIFILAVIGLYVSCVALCLWVKELLKISSHKQAHYVKEQVREALLDINLVLEENKADPLAKWAAYEVERIVRTRYSTSIKDFQKRLKKFKETGELKDSYPLEDY